MKIARRRRQVARCIGIRDKGLSKLPPPRMEGRYAVYEINLADFGGLPDIELTFERQWKLPR